MAWVSGAGFPRRESRDAPAPAASPSGHLPGESAERRPAGDGDWEPPGERRWGRRESAGRRPAGAPEAGAARTSRPRVQEALKTSARCEPLGLGRRRGGERGRCRRRGRRYPSCSRVLPWPPTPLLSCGGGSSRRGSRARRRGRRGRGSARRLEWGAMAKPGWLTSTRKPRTRASGSAEFSLPPASCRSLSSASAGSVPRCRICKPRQPTARCCRCSRSERCSSAPSPVAPTAGAPRSTPASRSTGTTRVQLQGAAAQRRAPAPDQPQGKDAPGGLPAPTEMLGFGGGSVLNPCAGWPGVCRRYQEGQRALRTMRTGSKYTAGAWAPVLQEGLCAATCDTRRLSLHTCLAWSQDSEALAQLRSGPYRTGFAGDAEEPKVNFSSD